MLAAQAESLCRDLLPAGKKQGNEWCVGDVHGGSGESLKIHLNGDRAGLWADFATGGDHSGDLLDLICAVRNVGLGEALDYACKFLGIERPRYTPHKPREYERPTKDGIEGLRHAEPVTAWLASRGLKAATIEAYKVAAKDRKNVVFPYLRGGELIHVKYRDIKNKKMMWTSKDTEPCLFGWQVVPERAREIVITEGEIDAMTMYQWGYPALSVPYGAGKGDKQQNWIDTEYDNLQRFDTIYVCMDADDEGRLAMFEIVDRLGRHRCKVVELPGKDANACLMAGVQRDVIDRAITDARTLDPAELRNIGSYRADIIRRFHPESKELRGFTMPWRTIDNQFYFEWGCTTIVAGYNGHGKTTVIGHLVAEAISQNVKTAVASLEFKPEKWVSALVRQVTAKPLPERDEIGVAVDWLMPFLWAFDVTGRGMGTARIDRLLEVFAYARQRYGCRLFVIDNFAKLGIAEDDYNTQKAAIVAITEFAVEHDVHIIVAAHMRKADNDQVRGGKLGVRGSAAITDLADNVWEVQRNRGKESAIQAFQAQMASTPDPDARANIQEQIAEQLEKHDTRLSCEKNRNGDYEPVLLLWFDRGSHQFTGRDEKPRRYA